MYSASQLLALGVSLAVCATAVLYADLFAELFPAREVSLSVSEQQQMLASLTFHASKSGDAAANGARNDGDTRAPPRLAFCCSADLDVAVPAVELMQSVQAVERQHLQKKKEGFNKGGKTSDGLIKRHHERIGSLKELQESFAYYFSSGAAAEQSTLTPEQFREVVALADALPGVNRKVGGNAATMAERASAEGCIVLLGAAIGKQMKPYFRDPRIQLVGHLEEHQHEDVHLVLEYASGDAFRGHTSPRANRYYLNHDVHNARLSVLEEFEQSLEAFKPDLVVFGGLQLMEVETDERGRLMRLKALSEVLQNLFLAQTPTHYEFAAVSDFSLFDDTVRLVLPWVDSIGLNEQELFILHHYLVTGEEGTATTSRPTVAEISAQLHDVIQFASKAKKNFQTSGEDKDEDKQEVLALAQLSRIHFHTLQFHIVCQKEGSMWEDPKAALVQSALMSSKVACGKPPAPGSEAADDDKPKPMRTSAEMEVDPERIEILLARQQLLSKSQGLKVDLDPFSPVVTWQEADFQCHLVPMLACKKPDHTAGLGDNISGTGVAYHRIQKKSEANN
ncbi:ADP-dependent glucokinase [Phytophthora ramorum]|uniref:ADP-dependent glucokinase n=1 Tax=Phytophthora ramorum TaxID=164328 RepID=UPI0030AE775C|nr:ADP-dependent glucokinase [Phytophthora ramorum]